MARVKALFLTMISEKGSLGRKRAGYLWRLTSLATHQGLKSPEMAII
ncbi:hypothetical protein C789_2121 [Microcystis aeruginosa FACHB-905 = DIANCHI905]|uniref:Uncharacterized protein n=1 Tax=Microcystis aeruginosa PCC 7806SL TaxID=1903187 RepID=A0AB33BLP6_MICA7|nr:hypothetical protein BH695_2148 [Microcystis aeruginosa PCC 7806SL]ELS48101.1 hypothetical protein C789_2121 [Microcystis aeruginosa FACHB-905 = DIANCHI905]